MEKILQKVGALKTEELTFEQFAQVFNMLQEYVDMSKVNFDDIVKAEEEQASKASSKKASAKAKESAAPVPLSSSKNPKVLRVEDESEVVTDGEEGEEEDNEDEENENDEDGDDYSDEDDEDEEEDMTPEEVARMVFMELCETSGKGDRLRLKEFIAWEEIQELLESGALTKANLATAIENSGMNMNDKQLEKSTMNFDTFYDLLQIIENYVDQDKIPNPILDDEKATERISVLNKQMTDLLLADEKDEKASRKESKKAEALKSIEDDLLELENSLEKSDAEVVEMFEELSKGKGFVTEKALRKWDELRGLIDAGMCSKENVDSYIEALKLKDGKLTLEQFRLFMDMLDDVLSDETGDE